jgi:subtilisin family serine protease
MFSAVIGNRPIGCAPALSAGGRRTLSPRRRGNMGSRYKRGVVAVVAVTSVLAGLFAGIGSAGAATPAGRYIVVVRNAGDLKAVRTNLQGRGVSIIRSLPAVNALVVRTRAGSQVNLSADRRVRGIAKDRVISVAPPEGASALRGGPTRLNAKQVKIRQPRGVEPNAVFQPDPAFGYKGLMWNFSRIRAQRAWRVTRGSLAVSVGVADTGLDYTHSELATKVVDVFDLTQFEDPPLCESFFGMSDQDLADEFGGPVDGDWHGHGSWIGGNIGAARDHIGINGIAPRVPLVSLKIAQWCGFAYDSTLIDAFITAADNDIDIVSISFGGYLDRSDPEQDLIYNEYAESVVYARSKGTLIVAAAGNEHTRIGAGGLVLSHGTLTAPDGELFDAFGLYEVPGGVPGVVDVASSGRFVNLTSETCSPDDSDNNNATCKPQSDAHQPFGMGRRNQLAYYSNYGPRIDVAAPGGARKFNLPVWDRGGTPGFPYTDADLTNVWEEFSITSNWATQIPCFTLSAAGGFYPNECYTSIQGTSMATPHASAMLALIASRFPSLREKPSALVFRLKSFAYRPDNVTPGLDPDDLSGGDLSGGACNTGYCHLGGSAISDAEAYGAGIVSGRAVFP